MKKNSTKRKKLLSTYALKILLIMKLSIFLIFFGVFQTFAVDLLSQKIVLKLSEEQTSLSQVLKEIEMQTNVRFLYRSETIENKTVKLDVHDKTWFDILEQIKLSTDVDYKILDNNLVVIAPSKDFQQRTITGKVTDNTGQPLAGVTIFIKETTIGSITDINGNYTISVPANAQTLVFSYIGMETREEPIGNKTSIDVTLMPDAILMSEVVVVGYGTQRRSDITGSLVSVSSEDFNKQPLTRIDQALQGRAAGTQVTQTSGEPGTGYKIRIRGANSISGNNDPLYVLDGLIIDNINSLNVNDIQSIEVLKDASATAVYGSRGANGVVLITTKSGSAGEAKVTLETFYGISNITKRLPVMSAADFAEGVNAAEGLSTFTPQEIADLRASGGEDWQERMFKQAATSNIQLSLSGGNEAVNYFISGNYHNQDGAIINQNYKRYNLRANLNAQLSKKLKAGINIFGSKELFDGHRSDIFAAIVYDPTTPAFDENGDYIYSSLKNVGSAGLNPLIAPENNIREVYDNHIFANGYFSYKILENLVLRVSGGVDILDRTRNTYTPILVNNIGNAAVFNQGISRLQNTNMLTYTWDKHENHRMRIDAIHEQQLMTNVSTDARSNQFFTDLTTFKNLALGNIQNITNTSFSESIQSFLGRINYSLLDRYLLTATLRADGSSKFREDQRWGYFPSASVAWRLSEESFMQNVGVINNLKLRASYGITGSQAIQPLATRSRPVLGLPYNYPFTGQSAAIGIAPSNRIANPDLTWEQTAQTNAGIDLGMWASRFTLSLDLYKKNTTDLLLDVVLPEFLGPNIIARNIGEVENKGFDIVLGFIPLQNDDWRITSYLNFSRNKNKVLSLIDDTPIEKGSDWYTGTFPVRPTRVEVGKPISSFRGYIFEGVYQLGEEEEAAKYSRNPGDAKYRDINEDGIISTDDITTIGDGNPDFIWGWNTTVSWKGFDLNSLVLGSQGNDIYNFLRGRMMSLGSGTFHAVHEDYKNRWTPDNPSNIPSGRDGTEYLSSQFLEDGSYVTLKNISLSYTFRAKDIMNKLGLSALRIYASAENLLMITKYTGFDPEATASGNSDVDLGIDLNAYPLSRTYNMGLSVTF